MIEPQTISGVGAIGAWKDHRARAEATGLWPLLLGRADEVSILIARLEDERTPDPDAVLGAARAFDTDAWLVAQLAYLGPENYSRGKPAKKPRPRNLYRTHLDLTGRPFAQVGFALVPAHDSCEAAARMAFGDYCATKAVGNFCPRPDVGIAMLLRWQERYGAELVAMTADQLELAIARPPKTLAAAAELAREHLAFCPDEVDQNATSLEVMTELLCKAPVWAFWWD